MIRTIAPGKVNLCLFVGEPRADGYHPIVSVFQSVSLADDVTLEVAGDRDEVICPEVPGPNLAARALAAYREATGWDGPPVRVTIEKRIPVAAGMGGGSADAAAVLRLAAEAAGRPDDPLLAEIAPTLGADVPFQLAGGRALVTGIGERVEALPAQPQRFVILPSQHHLSTADVYARFDRMGAFSDLAAVERRVRAGEVPLVNDLQDAARSLCPEIDERLALLGEGALVAGSGPTVFAPYTEARAVLPGAIAVESL